MKIYTKTGDKGQTSLIGGTRVAKNHIRIEAYGTVDELNSWLGLVRDSIQHPSFPELLTRIQDRLFTIGSLLAADPEKSKMKLPQLKTTDIEVLEQEIDKMNQDLPEMKSFILPGGHPVSSYCHIARCVCRRAERKTIDLSLSQPVEPLIIQYLNRLSDYLFVLARYVLHINQASEIPWKPEM